MKKKSLLAILALLILTGFDQLIKQIVVSTMDLNESIPVIPDVFEICYIRNQGVAWGMFQNRQIIFIILTLIVFILGVIAYHRIPKIKKFQTIRILMIFIGSGAIGNLIDRVFRGDFCQGQVVDFLYFKLIDFPIFNIADMYISICVILAFIVLIFIYKDKDFDELLAFVLKKENTNSQEDASSDN